MKQAHQKLNMDQVANSGLLQNMHVAGRLCGRIAAESRRENLVVGSAIALILTCEHYSINVVRALDVAQRCMRMIHEEYPTSLRAYRRLLREELKDAP